MAGDPDDLKAGAILDATLDVLARHGLRGATTRAISRHAGVNEVTLFRRYGSKAGLIRAALLRQAQGLGERGIHDSGDLRADLETLVREYQGTLRRLGPVLGVLITELPRHPEYRPVLDGPRALLAQIGGLLGRYQARGELRPEALGTLIPALVGPLVLPYLLPAGIMDDLSAEVGGAAPHSPEPPFPDPAAHVRAFLHGRAVPQEETP